MLENFPTCGVGVCVCVCICVCVCVEGGGGGGGEYTCVRACVYDKSHVLFLLFCEPMTQRYHLPDTDFRLFDELNNLSWTERPFRPNSTPFLQSYHTSRFKQLKERGRQREMGGGGGGVQQRIFSPTVCSPLHLWIVDIKIIYIKKLKNPTRS